MLPFFPVRLHGAVAEAALLDLVARSVRDGALSDDERQAVGLIGAAAASFGPGLLAAREPDALRDAVSHVLRESRFHQALFDVARAAWTVLGRRWLIDEVSDVAATLAERLGEPLIAEGVVQAGFIHADGARLIGQAVGDPTACGDDWLAAPAANPMGFVTDVALPHPVMIRLLAGVHAQAYLMAVCHAAFEGPARPADMLPPIAKGWLNGQRYFLSLLASLPGSRLPLVLVPAEERLDLDALGEQAGAQEGAWCAALAALRGKA